MQQKTYIGWIFQETRAAKCAYRVSYLGESHLIHVGQGPEKAVEFFETKLQTTVHLEQTPIGLRVYTVPTINLADVAEAVVQQVIVNHGNSDKDHEGWAALDLDIVKQAVVTVLEKELAL